jgi:hypothetical protein
MERPCRGMANPCLNLFPSLRLHFLQEVEPQERWARPLPTRSNLNASELEENLTQHLAWHGMITTGNESSELSDF